ncbi:hypothetical protein [Haliscomenobacter hydrossis]|uniref:Uncharacterized protein n=1 Tax=Haliscomenobacter hydrossis (strain ATCC 27775 / DSM 1100 / LMG 10767 / O) TaxID=760192 RepID=F4KU55_HALH1|nr:hypothetical protein [Haliscomenobacter hydrossis]AEE50152.1 hypothetical protein Halhy_2273 [Haliscomenobacter hydrossis DSM 1100]
MSNSMILLMALFLFLACQKEMESSTEGVFIRIQNTSKFSYQDIKVVIAEERLYEPLAPGASSAYQRFSKAFRYAYIELKINGKRFGLQPIDYVGEEELKDGKYTYQLNVEDTSSLNRQVNLTFKED